MSTNDSSETPSSVNSSRADVERMIREAGADVFRISTGLDAVGRSDEQIGSNLKLNTHSLRLASEQLKASAGQLRAYVAELDRLAGRLDVLVWAAGEVS